MKNYRRSLSLDSALATVSFDKDGIHYRRDFFVSYPANVLVMRFSASKKEDKTLYYHMQKALYQKALCIRTVTMHYYGMHVSIITVCNIASA